MSKITSITPQKKRKDRFNIFLDRKYAFSVSNANFEDFKLFEGRDVDKAEVEKILKKEKFAKLFDLALNFLSFRARSTKEINDYLTRKISKQENVPFREAKESQLIVEILAKLKKYKFINDLQFAKWQVASRSKNKKGIFFIRAELKNKGIGEEMIEQALKDLPNQNELAKKAVEKKIQRWSNLSELEFKKKIYSFLARGGFSSHVVMETVAFFSKKR